MSLNFSDSSNNDMTLYIIEVCHLYEDICYSTVSDPSCGPTKIIVSQVDQASKQGNFKRNMDSDTEGIVDQKMNLCFIYKSCGILKSFNMFLFVKFISKLNIERRVEFRLLSYL